MLFYRHFLYAILIILLATTPLFADAIRLSGGQVVEGTIVSENETYIIMKTLNGTLSFEKKDVLEIEKAGTKKIVREPLAGDYKRTGAALRSFIPGYSGLYESKTPSAGIPFAVGNFYYGLNMLYFYFDVKKISLDKSEWNKSGTNFFISYYGSNSLMSQSMYQILSSQGCNYSSNCNINTYQSSFYGSLAMTNFIQRQIYKTLFQEYKVNNAVYTKHELAVERERVLVGYLFFSSISALLSYYHEPITKFILSNRSADAEFAIYGLPVPGGMHLGINGRY